VLLLLPFVQGEEIFSGLVDNQGIIPIEERTFTILISSSQQFIRIEPVDMPDLAFEIKEDSCKLVDNIRICYNFSQWDSTINNQRAYLMVFKEPLMVEVNRTIDDIKMFAGDTREIEVDIVNIGTATIDSLEYYDEFPSEIAIECRSRCEVIENSVYWSGEVKKGSTTTLTYDITALDQVKRNLKGRVELYDGFNNETFYTESLDFNIQHYLNVTPDFNDEEIDLGHRTQFYIYIKNIGEEGRIDVEYFDIFIPKGLEVIYHSDTLDKINETLYRWNGHLDYDRSEPKNFTFKVRGVLPGFSNIYIRSKYMYDNLPRTLSKKSIGLISILDQEPQIVTSLEKYLLENDYLESFEEVPYKVYIENPTNISFYSVVVNTDYPERQEFTISKLEPQVYKKIFDKDIIVEDVSRKIKRKVRLNVTYKDKIGTVYNNFHDFDVPIEPVKRLDILHEFSSTDLYGEDEVVVDVYVSNTRNTDLEGLKIYDILPDYLPPIGLTTATINLNKNREDVKIYSYKVKLPFVNETTPVPFRTYFKYESDNRSYRYFIEQNFSVELQEDLPSLDVAFTVETDKDEVYRGEIMPVEYLIDNEENQTLWDLRITLTLSDQYDTISDLTYKIDKLDALSEVTINDFNYLRVKRTGSVMIRDARLTYKDDDGKLYGQRCKNLSIDSNQGYIEGPFLLVEKEIFNDTVMIDEEFKVKLTLTNLGDEPATVNIKDGGNEWSIDVRKNSKEFLEYMMKFYRNGSYNLDGAEYDYGFRDFSFKSISNGLQVEALSPPPVINISNETEPEVEVIEIEEIVNVTAQNDTKEPPFFVKLLANSIFIYVVLGGLAIFTFGLTLLIFKKKEDEQKDIFNFSAENNEDMDNKIRKIHDKLKEGKK